MIKDLLRKLICTVFGCVRICLLKISHPKHFKFVLPIYVSPFSEISLSRKGILRLGKYSQLRNNAKIRIRNGGTLEIGKNFHSGNDSIIVCHDEIIIGDHVQFGPGVLVYDHDHDFTHPDGLKAEKYLTTPVKIGSSVWIGARSIILRGTEIGDNCVIAAGSILKGKYPSNSIIYQPKPTQIKPYILREE